MRKIWLFSAVTALAFAAGACTQNYLTIRELPSDVARAGQTRTHKWIKKKVRVENKTQETEATQSAQPQLFEQERTGATWLIFDYNGIETLYWCTPSHEMTDKPACIPARYGGAAIFPEPGLKNLPLPKPHTPLPESR